MDKTYRRLIGTLMQIAVLILTITLVLFKKEITNQELGIIITLWAIYLEETIRQRTEKE